MKYTGMKRRSYKSTTPLRRLQEIYLYFFLYCVIINIIGSGSSLNRNLTDCTGPHAPSEGVGRPKGGLGVVPTRNFTDLLVQLQIRNNPQSAWLTCGSGDGRVAQ